MLLRGRVYSLISGQIGTLRLLVLPIPFMLNMCQGIQHLLITPTPTALKECLIKEVRFLVNRTLMVKAGHQLTEQHWDVTTGKLKKEVFWHEKPVQK